MSVLETSVDPMSPSDLLEGSVEPTPAEALEVRVESQIARVSDGISQLDVGAENNADPTVADQPLLVEDSKLIRYVADALPLRQRSIEQIEAEIEGLSEQVRSGQNAIVALRAEVEELSAALDQRPPAIPSPLVEPTFAARAESPAPPQHRSAQSIENFMYQLLDRVRGKQHTPPSNVTEIAPRVESEVMEVLEFERQAREFSPERRSPRPTAWTGNLEAMRRLANDSARHALDSFAWRTSVEYARQHWSYAGFGLFWATIAWMVLKDNSLTLGRSVAGLGLGLALVLAGVGAWRAIHWRQKLP